MPLHPWQEDHWLPGVLSKKQVKKLIDREYLNGVSNFEKAADYSAIDLTLSDHGYKMTSGAIKPCGSPKKNYSSFLHDSKYAQKLSPDQEGCFKLKKNECYVFPLAEKLTNKLIGSNIFGMATAKSSVGRVDVIARLIIDGMRLYEYLNPEYMENSTGHMFLEIIPISFNVRVKPGISLSQLRFFYGHPDKSIIDDDDFIKGALVGSDDGKGYLSVDLSETDVSGLKVVAYRALESEKENYVDLWKKNEDLKPDSCQFWYFDSIRDDDGRFTLQHNSFYLLRSKERIALPGTVAVYARPMDETLGEMRIHYAGFAHPYFGLGRKDGKKGTPLIFEVRAYSVNVNLEHGESLAKLAFYRMSERLDENKDKDPGYNDQELQLSGFFRKWPDNLECEDSLNGRVRRKG